MATRGISAGIRQAPNPGALKTIGEVSSYISELAGWASERFSALDKQAKTIPYASVDDLPPFDGPPRLIAVPDDPTYGQVLCFNGVGTSGTATGWYRLVPAGTAGAPAASFPPGGTTSQVLGKHGTADYDMEWQTPHYVPAGGATGQALRKTGTADYAEAWGDVHEVPAGGTTSQVLAKTGTADYATAWTTIYPLPAGGTGGQALVKNTTATGDASWSNHLGTTTVDALEAVAGVHAAGNVSADGIVSAGGTASFAQFDGTAAYLGHPVKLANQTTSGTVGTAGTASALPATPGGYLHLEINGTTVVVPFYAP